MKWYTLFRQHILDRGIEYYEDEDGDYCLDGELADYI